MLLLGVCAHTDTH